MKVGVIVTAAGRSERFSAALGQQAIPRSKLEEDILGRPVLMRAVEPFTKNPVIASIIVAGPHDPQQLGHFKDRFSAHLGMLGGTIVPGGKDHRHQTVAAALPHVPDTCTHVLVHDGARPCLAPDLLDRLIDAAATTDAVIPAIPVGDTVKRVTQRTAAAARDAIDDILGTPSTTVVREIVATADRTNLWLAQTPQLFRLELLRAAYAAPDPRATDDAQQVERLGKPVLVIKGDPRNIKITLPIDLELARLYTPTLARAAAMLGG